MLTERQMTVAAGFMFLLVILVWQLASTSANTGGSVALDCDALTPGVQSNCSYPSGTVFDVQVHVTSAPAGGYFAQQTKLRWEDGQVGYQPAATAAEENLWAACTWAGRADNWTADPPDPSLLFGCVPFPLLTVGETMTGALAQFRFACEQNGTSRLTLIPREGDLQGGTHFLDAMLQPLDPSLEGATVVCGQTATPPATAPSQPTSAATPTPSGVPAPSPEATSPATPSAAPTSTLAPTATGAPVLHDPAIVDKNRRLPGIQIGGWSGALRVPFDSAAGATKRVSVTVENRSDHSERVRLQLIVGGVGEGCFVDGDGDDLPDALAGERQVTLGAASKTTFSFAVTIECHAPRRVGDTFQVELLAQLEDLDGAEPPSALADNTGSATGEVSVVSR